MFPEVASMKIILSRKGFDSSSGGFPNPLLPNDWLLSLPIPDPAAPYNYDELSFRKYNLGQVVRELSGGRMSGKEKAHLDPDLHKATVKRAKGWRPLFGQCGAAQGHLSKQGVGPGDLFLFFSWFRQTEMGPQGLRFRKDARDYHILYGWFQVDQMLDLSKEEPKSWMRDHPHCFGKRSGCNMLYVAREQLSLPVTNMPPKKGAALFGKQWNELFLSFGKTRRYWRLPDFFDPKGKESSLSYHENPSVWSDNRGGEVSLKSAARGQEFVLDTHDYPEAINWAAELIHPALRHS